jgi:hypothetical protein
MKATPCQGIVARMESGGSVAAGDRPQLSAFVDVPLVDENYSLVSIQSTRPLCRGHVLCGRSRRAVGWRGAVARIGVFGG